MKKDDWHVKKDQMCNKELDLLQFWRVYILNRCSWDKVAAPFCENPRRHTCI